MASRKNGRPVRMPIDVLFPMLSHEVRLVCSTQSLFPKTVGISILVASLLVVVRPGAPSIVLVPSSDARSP